jgi:hypothetical protein
MFLLHCLFIVAVAYACGAVVAGVVLRRPRERATARGGARAAGPAPHRHLFRRGWQFLSLHQRGSWGSRCWACTPAGQGLRAVASRLRAEAAGACARPGRDDGGRLALLRAAARGLEFGPFTESGGDIYDLFGRLQADVGPGPQCLRRATRASRAWPTFGAMLQFTPRTDTPAMRDLRDELLVEFRPTHQPALGRGARQHAWWPTSSSAPSTTRRTRSSTSFGRHELPRVLRGGGVLLRGRARVPVAFLPPLRALSRLGRGGARGGLAFAGLGVLQRVLDAGDLAGRVRGHAPHVRSHPGVLAGGAALPRPGTLIVWLCYTHYCPSSARCWPCRSGGLALVHSARVSCRTSRGRAPARRPPGLRRGPRARRDPLRERKRQGHRLRVVWC